LLFGLQTGIIVVVVVFQICLRQTRRVVILQERAEQSLKGGIGFVQHVLFAVGVVLVVGCAELCIFFINNKTLVVGMRR
jgi:hypothetical protein